MNALALLLAGHLIGDWIVQSDRQALCKSWPNPVLMAESAERFYVDPLARNEPTVDAEWMPKARRSARLRSWGYNQAHMATYHATMLAFLLLGSFGWHRTAFTLAVSWVTHSFIDRRWPVRWLLAHTGSATFSELPWGVIAADQALHLSILAVLSTVLR